MEMPNLKFLGMHSGRDYATRGAGGLTDHIAEEAMREVYGDAKTDEILHGYRRSIVNVDKLIEDFKSCNDAEYIKVDFNTPAMKYAMKRVREDFNPGKVLNPVHYRECENYDFPENTSAEEPYRTSPEFDGFSKKKTDCKRHCFTHGIIDLHRIKDGEKVKIFDILANARSHIVPSDEEDKVRMVFGYPFRELTFESMWYWPYYTAIRERPDHILMWGREMYNGGMKHLHNLLKSGQTYMCLDFRQFDKLALCQLIDWCFETLYSYFDVEYYYPDADGVKRPTTNGSERLRRAFEHVKEFFMHGPVRLPKRERYERIFATIPSGSMFTQLIDSMINALVIYATTYEALNTEIDWLRVLGDDSTSGMDYAGDLSTAEMLERITAVAWDRFRMKINPKPEKSIITKNRNEVQMLGYTNKNGYPTRSEDDLLARILHPEGSIDDDEVRAGRAVGLAWAALGSHPLFTALCRRILQKIGPTEINLREYKYLLSDIVGVQRPTAAIPTSDELIGRLMGVVAI